MCSCRVSPGSVGTSWLRHHRHPQHALACALVDASEKTTLNLGSNYPGEVELGHGSGAQGWGLVFSLWANDGRSSSTASSHGTSTWKPLGAEGTRGVAGPAERGVRGP